MLPAATAGCAETEPDNAAVDVARRRSIESPAATAGRSEAESDNAAAEVARRRTARTGGTPYRKIAEPPKIRCHFLRGRIAVVRILCRRLGDDMVEHRGNAFVATAGCRGRLLDDLVDDRVEIAAMERRKAGQHLVEHGAQRKDVGTPSYHPSHHLLRRHVFGRAEDIAGHRARSRGKERDAEIGDLHQAAFQHHDIGWLDIAVHDAFVVREREPIRNLRHDVDDFFRREHHAGVENFAQRLSIEEFHRDVGNGVALSHVVDRDDVGMVEPPCGPRFAIEALLECDGFRIREIKRNGLDRDDAIDQRVPGPVHDAHRPVAEFPDDLVASEFF